MTDDAGFSQLMTEAIRPEELDLDLLSTSQLVTMMADDVADVQRAIRNAAEPIARSIDGIADRMLGGGRLIYIGAGTSGRLALIDAVECVPTFSVPPGQVQAIIAGGAEAAASAVESAEDSAADARHRLTAVGVGPADSVVGLSASGLTPWVLEGVRCAAEAGALTVGISCNHGSKLSASVDFPIELLVGPELLAGSTRLKSGTAQKVVLNAISTITMVRLGKTYRNLMVDVKPTNAKLRDRAARIVSQLTGAQDGEVLQALRATGDDTKAAIVVLARGVSPRAAHDLLRECGGSLRVALSR